MKILYVTTIGITMGFFKSFVRELLDAGHTVDIATNDAEAPVPPCYAEWGCRVYTLPCSRSPFKKGNLSAIKKIKAIVKQGGYELVHCHTPIAAACTRLACKKLRKQSVRVIYTAHGFHFYKGAPKKNWMIFYPIEKLCARYTDTLITINQEDFALAQKKMKAKEVVYVPGVGIDLQRFHAVAENCRTSKREELGIPQNATLLLSVGELNENKNHETVIRALHETDAYYIIAGKGHLQERLQTLIDELGMSERVKLLGFRSDVAELYAAADMFVFPSFREGLSVSVMEAMATGLPCVVSQIRGNTDLVDEQGGRLFDPYSVASCKEAVCQLLSADRAALGAYNREKIKRFSIETVNQQMKSIYGV